MNTNGLIMTLVISLCVLFFCSRSTRRYNLTVIIITYPVLVEKCDLASDQMIVSVVVETNIVSIGLTPDLAPAGVGRGGELKGG